MRAVVTGGAGFLGSHLCDRLLAEGWDVLALDNLITGSASNIDHLKGNSKFHFENRDVNKPFDIPGEVGYVFHFASPASPPDYLRFPIETLKVGSIATMHALDLTHAKHAKFLMASTSECYGDPDVSPQSESYWGRVNPVGPRSVYDEAKRFSEALTMAHHRARGTDVTIARIFNTYGPRLRPDDGRVVSNFLLQAMRGEPLTVYGDGSQTRSLCYVEDEVRGLLALLDSDL